MFGTGKTSVKVNFGRYLEAAQNGGLFIALNPTGAPVDDDDAGVDRREPQLRGRLQPAESGRAGPARDAAAISAAPNANANFGTQVFESTLDPALLSGWGVRSGDWQWGASVQQEVLPRVAVEVGYQRRWLVNSLVTDNRARGARGPHGVRRQRSHRLAAAGRRRRRARRPLQRHAGGRDAAERQLPDAVDRTIGDWTQVANSVNLNVTARMRNGLVLQGGFNTGTTGNDYCDVRSAIPEWTVRPRAVADQPVVRHVDGMGHARDGARHRTRFRRSTCRSPARCAAIQGGQLAANWTAPNSATVGLNRPFAGIGGQTITVNLIEPGTLYGDRVNQIDMRFAKILRFGRTRTTVGFDVYNLTNSAPVLTYNQTFVADDRPRGCGRTACCSRGS